MTAAQNTQRYIIEYAHTKSNYKKPILIYSRTDLHLHPKLMNRMIQTITENKDNSELASEFFEEVSSFQQSQNVLRQGHKSQPQQTRILQEELEDELPILIETETANVVVSREMMFIGACSLLIFIAAFFLVRRKRRTQNLVQGGETWGGDYDYANVAAEYDELLEDTFIDDEFTQDGDSDEESITSILSEWSRDENTSMKVDLGVLEKQM